MHKNFAMMVLQTVSHTRAEACPPPCVNTTNKLQPFGHRRGKKTSTRPMRFAQLAEPPTRTRREYRAGIGSSMTELLISKQHRANSVARIGPAILARLL